MPSKFETKLIWWFSEITLYLENSELDLAALFDATPTRFCVCIQHFRQVEEDSGLVRRFVISIAVTLDETIGALDDGNNTCKYCGLAANGSVVNWLTDIVVWSVVVVRMTLEELSLISNCGVFWKSNTRNSFAINRLKSYCKEKS